MSPREIMVACLKCLPLWDHPPLTREEREAVMTLGAAAIGVIVLYYCALFWMVDQMNGPLILPTY